MSFISWGTEVYYSPVVRAILRNTAFCLTRELKDCETVLDLGCGYNSALKYCPVRFSVGVEYSLQYLLESRKKRIHNSYLRADINRIEFRPRSFDAVLLLSVIEHMDKESGLRLLEKAAAIAKRKIIVVSPNGYLSQGPVEGNVFQEHKSGWIVNELKTMGFRAYGLSGLKMFRKASHIAEGRGHLLSTVRLKPRTLWLCISELSQTLAYYFPALAFEVFYIKDIRP